MGKLKDKIFVDGYNPFNIFNIILSVVSGCIFAIFIYGFINGYTMQEMLGTSKDSRYLLVAIVCFLLLLFRNRKLKSIPKMIIFSVVSSALGVLVAIVGFALLILFGIFSGGDTSKFRETASKVANATSTGGNNNGQNGFSKQDDLNAQMQGYANAQQYQDLTGFSGHDINPDDDYTRA